jgi:hypothetical protein
MGNCVAHSGFCWWLILGAITDRISCEAGLPAAENQNVGGAAMAGWLLTKGLAAVELAFVICAVWLTATISRAEDGSGTVRSADTIAIAPANDSAAPPSTVTKSVGVAESTDTGAAAPATDSTATPPAPKTPLQQAVFEIKATAADLARLTAAQRRKWETAVASLPSFCQDWSRMLHDREVNNLLHLQWQGGPGGETATYTGYGTVENCQAKESSEGVPIGKVTYEERNYALYGKSIDDAKAHPQLTRVTRTLEIFSYEKDRWFY